MDKDRLEQLKTEVDTRFNELSDQRTQISEEMLRLAGEHRTYTKLIEEVTKLEGVVTNGQRRRKRS